MKKTVRPLYDSAAFVVLFYCAAVGDAPFSRKEGLAMPTLEQIRATFAADRFATEAAGCEILLAEPGHAVCAMTLTPRHRNAAGTPQGGAIFTVADFAFAVAVNAFAEFVTVSLQHDITFLSPSRGSRVQAEAKCVRAGRSTCYYTVTVTDDLGATVAQMTVNGFVTQKKMS